jgi:UDP-glucose 4-epimerase
MYILVTGGFGYIGSHTVVKLLNSGYKVIIVDNSLNSKQTIIDNIKKVSEGTVIYYTFNLANSKNSLNFIFKKHDIRAVIHFAGLKSLSESLVNPLLYYNNNLISTLNLLYCMEMNNCYNLIFSSSATIYGDCKCPVTEDVEIGKNLTNPYGKSKYMIEEMLMDITKSNPKWNIVSLRYFNPVGAHPSGLLGENPNNIPNNLMPLILYNAYRTIGDYYSVLEIYGNDYGTIDGTCIRDFIHIMDLTQAHIVILQNIFTSDKLNGYSYYNVGTGRGVTVMKMLETFERVNNVKLDYKYVDRREGDLECVFADVNKIKNDFGWESKFTLEDICRDAWNYYTTFMIV